MNIVIMDSFDTDRAESATTERMAIFTIDCILGTLLLPGLQRGA